MNYCINVGEKIRAEAFLNLFTHYNYMISKVQCRPKPFNILNQQSTTFGFIF